MEQKQVTGSIYSLKQYSLGKLAALFLSVVLIGFSSCKNKGGGKLLSREDSASVYQSFANQWQAVYVMNLSAAKLEDLFQVNAPSPTNNIVKQIKFKWVKKGTDPWGLEAYGIDDKGAQITGPVTLEVPDKNVYLRNFRLHEFENDYITTRGHLKYILGVGTLGDDKPFAKGELKDLVIIPDMETPYPDPNSDIERMFFRIKKLRPAKSKDFFNELQTFGNPAPPFSFTCDPCDENVYNY